MEMRGQHSRELVELVHRPGPAVGEDDRGGAGVRAALVDEVDVESVDGGLEMVERVEPSFLVPPVEPRVPVLDQLAEVGQVGAIVPPDALELVGEPGA